MIAPQVIINGEAWKLIAYGYCKCGCGEKTEIAKRTESRKGWYKGQPRKYVHNHHPQKKQDCVGDKNANWKGGVVVRKNYLGVYYPGHPRATDNHVLEHILIAEKALGKPIHLPHVIHHHTPKQLVVCEDTAYHFLLHLRTRALRVCGHANWLKCNYCKIYDDPINLNNNSRTAYHRNCAKEYNRKRYIPKSQR